ncbi:MAG: PIN domain-containing protein, partial [Bacteroidota bacterium]
MGKRKIYVLDTSVILHDSQSINHFEENDIAIPITVLEELDRFKEGSQTRNFEAREFIRFVDKLAGKDTLQDWVKIHGENRGKMKVIMNHHPRTRDAEIIFEERKPDHKILNAAIALQEQEEDAKVILVTKDINLRLKAKALNLPAEDYETGKVKDVNNLYTGITIKEDINSEVIDTIFKDGFVPSTTVGEDFINNHYFILKNGVKSTLAY